ncbi:SAM-dependent DNA methyltransferase [Candidatus Sumerlaeota bacterium]|nr:SAM-dependent DNA methyltransferase [Candidatus Sumerlaeota bacterium]
MRACEAKKQFLKVMRQFHRHQPWRVFADFCEMAALSLYNVVPQSHEVERQYSKVVEGYSPEEMELFPKLLALAVEALDREYCDFLGDVFQELELHNHWKGQFFTPLDVCKAIAAMQLDGVKAAIERKGFVTVQEPACGAGAMLIGLCEAMRDAGVNYQEHMHVTAIDVDPTAAQMCYIQLTLLHVPAVVFIGNTLSLELRQAYKTFAHHIGFWDSKLSRGHLLGYEPSGEPLLAEAPCEEQRAEPDVVLDPVQLDLFEEATA